MTDVFDVVVKGGATITAMSVVIGIVTADVWWFMFGAIVTAIAVFFVPIYAAFVNAREAVMGVNR